jgi:hypothetical protein
MLSRKPSVASASLYSVSYGLPSTAARFWGFPVRSAVARPSHAGFDSCSQNRR